MISAIILAAGQSKRMGQPKMLLPWGTSTVIEQVISTFLNAGIEDVTVVTGGAREEIENPNQSISLYEMSTMTHYAAGEMLSSIESCALRTMPEQAQAVIIGLGDYPTLRVISVRLICDVYRTVIPVDCAQLSNETRSHPWLGSACPLWNEILAFKPP